MENVKVVENGVEAKKVIEQFIMKGFKKDDIYLLAHDKNRSEDLSDALKINDVGIAEQGLFESIGNVFRSRGDELRTKLESLAFNGRSQSIRGRTRSWAMRCSSSKVI